jgi:hypothetical protein
LTRRSVALVVAALGGAALVVAFQLAVAGYGSRVDVLLLAAAAIAHIVLVIAWWLAPWTPRWVIAGYGLVLASSGLGFLVVAPPEAPAVMSFYGMLAAGALAIIAAIIDR